jgi:nucleoid DNA-binding protein
MGIGEKVQIKIYKEVAAEQKVKTAVAEAAVREMFKFITKVLAADDDKGIRLQNFGVFDVPPNRRENLKLKKVYRIIKGEEKKKRFIYESEEE